MTTSRPAASVPLRDVRRGRDAGELEFIDTDGRVLLAHAHGVDEPERLRTREALLRLLAPLLERAT